MEIKEGYKNTKLGEIPNNWNPSNIGENASKIIGGGTPSRNNSIYWNGEIPWVTVKDFSNFNPNKAKESITEEGLKNSSANLIKSGTLIASTRMSLGKAFLYNVDVAINQDLKGIYLKKELLPLYLFYIFKLKQNNLEEIGCGSTVKGLSLNELKKISYPLPPLPEQKAIAEVLSDTDALIESLEAKIKKKKAIKKGAMQKLLQPLPHWEKFSINDICDIISGKDLSKNKLSKNGKYKCILYGELFTTYSEVIDTVKSKTNYAEGVLSKKGDILFPNSTTTIGEDLAKASSLEVSQVYLSGGIIILRKKKEYDSNFLSFFLNQVAKPEIAKQTKGITIYHLYGSDLRDIKVRLPKLAEQEYIAKSLNDMDEEIELLEVKLCKYRSLKEGLMQELLTGKIRLL